MSVHVTSRAWSVQGLTPAQKLVLVRLADQANDEGFCYPSVTRIASDVGLSRRRVLELIAALVDLGHVASVHRFHSSTRKQTSNAFCVLPPDDRRAADVIAAASDHVSGVVSSLAATHARRVAAGGDRRGASGEGCEVSHPQGCEGSHPPPCEGSHPQGCEGSHPPPCEGSHPNLQRKNLQKNLQASSAVFPVDPSSLTRFVRNSLLAGQSCLVGGVLVQPAAPEWSAFMLAVRAQSAVFVPLRAQDAEKGSRQ